MTGSGINHYQHKIKCLACSLHFIALSDREDWAPEFCPECGARNAFLQYGSQASPDFIFQVVPGSAPYPIGAAP